MDIVPKLTFVHWKASFQSLKLKQKFYLLIFLLALCVNLFPHESYAFSLKVPTADKPILIFDSSDKSYQYIIDSINASLNYKTSLEKNRLEAVKRGQLTVKVQSYLKSQRSPLAEYADVLTSVPNWKQIVALANAESTLCRNYPVTKANCWGVGGSNLWDMGTTLGDGILEMNKFLAMYPKNAKVKYSQMSFKQMNGLYKQPAAQHWLFNAQTVYDDLSVLEKNI